VNGVRRNLMHKGVLAVNQVTIELIPDAEQGGFTARIPDIPACGEGETEQKAIEDLKEAIRGYIEVFGLEDALSRVSSPEI
jgi:predicted RNase H-like HicB family nuclease